VAVDQLSEVSSVLRGAAVKKIVPLLSTRFEGIYLSLAAILNMRNARVLFIMAKRHPVRNSQFMKAIRDVHSFCLKVSPLVYEYRKHIENRF
jgi:hypothetical protein